MNNYRLDMLAALRKGAKHLGDTGDKLLHFYEGCKAADGGFVDRSGKSDLYYSVFGIEAVNVLIAMIDRMDTDSNGATGRKGVAGYRESADTNVISIDGVNATGVDIRTLQYLKGFGNGELLQLMDLICLARCWVSLTGKVPADIADILVDRLLQHRCADGGYNVNDSGGRGTVYGCFLALGSYCAMAIEIEDTQGIVECIKSLMISDGSFANGQDLPVGSVPATAAAITILKYLDAGFCCSDNAERTAHWLMSCHLPSGGFVAVPGLAVADMLSTAVALHALTLLNCPPGAIGQRCETFVRSLQNDMGGFIGNADDDLADCEYSWYALLALGHLF